MKTLNVLHLPSGLIAASVLFLLSGCSVFGAPPANDRFSDRATLLTGQPVHGDTRESTLDPGESAPAPFIPGSWAGTIWWEWTADASGWHEVSLAGANGAAAVWSEGQSLGAVKTIESAPTQLFFEARTGQKYQIAAGRGPTIPGGIVDLRVQRRERPWQIVDVSVSHPIVDTKKAAVITLDFKTRGVAPGTRMLVRAFREMPGLPMEQSIPPFFYMSSSDVMTTAIGGYDPVAGIQQWQSRFSVWNQVPGKWRCTIRLAESGPKTSDYSGCGAGMPIPWPAGFSDSFEIMGSATVDTTGPQIIAASLGAIDGTHVLDLTTGDVTLPVTINAEDPSGIASMALVMRHRTFLTTYSLSPGQQVITRNKLARGEWDLSVVATDPSGNTATATGSSHDRILLLSSPLRVISDSPAPTGRVPELIGLRWESSIISRNEIGMRCFIETAPPLSGWPGITLRSANGVQFQPILDPDLRRQGILSFSLPRAIPRGGFAYTLQLGSTSSPSTWGYGGNPLPAGAPELLPVPPDDTVPPPGFSDLSMSSTVLDPATGPGFVEFSVNVAAPSGIGTRSDYAPGIYLYTGAGDIPTILPLHLTSGDTYSGKWTATTTSVLLLEEGSYSVECWAADRFGRRFLPASLGSRLNIRGEPGITRAVVSFEPPAVESGSASLETFLTATLRTPGGLSSGTLRLGSADPATLLEFYFGPAERILGDSHSGTYRIPVRIPAGQASAALRASFTILTESQSQQHIFSNGPELVVLGPDGPLSPGVVSAVEVRPEIVDVTDGAGEVEITVHAYGDISGAASSPGGSFTTADLVSGTLEQGVWRRRVSIGYLASEGVYPVKVTRTVADGIREYRPGSNGVSGTPSYRIVRRDPVISQFRITPEAVTLTGVAQKVTVRLAAVFPADFTGAYVDTVDLTGRTFRLAELIPQDLISGTVRDGVWEREILVPPAMPPGGWPLVLTLPLSGKTFSHQFGGQMRPVRDYGSTVNLPFPAGSTKVFLVNNSAAPDTTPPVVEIIEEPATILLKPWQKTVVQFQFLASDAESGIGSVWISGSARPARVTLQEERADGTQIYAAEAEVRPEPSRLEISVSNRNRVPTSKPLSYTVVAPPGGYYNQWMGSVADPAPAADPDGDTIPNLLEYAFGLPPDSPGVRYMNPADALQGGLPAPGRNAAGALTLTWWQAVDWTPDLTFQAEASSDGIRWEPVASVEQGTSRGVRQMLATDPGDPDSTSRLMRVRIVRTGN